MLGVLLIAATTMCVEPVANPIGTPIQATGPLGRHVQLTFGTQFVKAGESYISPDGSKVIFQAVATPLAGEEADEHYAMYVGDLHHQNGSWRLDSIRQITPEGSANTCGWFHPTDPGKVIFASTVGPPLGGDTPGYQRGSGRYKWSYPPRMRIVEARIDGDFPPTLTPMEGDEKSYQAECSISPDGRHLLYTSHETGDGDIYIRDLQTGVRHLVVGAPGYDGGPFFSPDVYATSEAGHDNYEVFEVQAAKGGGVGKPARYGTGKRRITNVGGFDGLPAFNPDGTLMIWTSQQGGDGSQLWIAPFDVSTTTTAAGKCPVAH
jgi:Tol biopolymer transport system component